GRAELGELLRADLRNGARGGEGLALDARTGDGDRVQAGRGLLALCLFGLLGQCSTAAREGNRTHRQGKRDRVPQLVSLQSHLSLQRENWVFPMGTSPVESRQTPKPARLRPILLG